MTREKIIEYIVYYCGEDCVLNENEIKTPKLCVEFEEELLHPEVYNVRFRSDSAFVRIFDRDIEQIGFLQGKLLIATTNTCVFHLET